MKKVVRILLVLLFLACVITNVTAQEKNEKPKEEYGFTHKVENSVLEIKVTFENDSKVIIFVRKTDANEYYYLFKTHTVEMEEKVTGVTIVSEDGVAGRTSIKSGHMQFREDYEFLILYHAIQIAAFDQRLPKFIEAYKKYHKEQR